jgi:predicted DNA-binding ribbon-helix-helix protein
MKSPVVKRSIVIAGHKTSVSLEGAFWKGLKEIAASRNLNLSELVASIDTARDHGNLSSAIRLFVLDHYRARISIEENRRASPVESVEQLPGGSQQGAGGGPMTRSNVQTRISA